MSKDFKVAEVVKWGLELANAQGAAAERERIINLVKQLHDDAVSSGDMMQTAKAYAYEYLIGILKDGERDE